MAINPQLPKITRPKVSGVLRRERLLRQLDKSRKQPVIWIVTADGSQLRQVTAPNKPNKTKTAVAGSGTV